ncbi:hypothetical protein ABLE92_24415 [Gordonia sp. VNQ95]
MTAIVILVLAYVVGFTVAYLVGRAEGVDAERSTWRKAIERQLNTPE